MTNQARPRQAQERRINNSTNDETHPEPAMIQAPAEHRAAAERAGFWAVTAYFNPAKWTRRRSNYHLFRRHLTVPLLTVEFSVDGRFELDETDANSLIQIEQGDAMWQKERLLNIGSMALPSSARYVAWLDCDILFEDPLWWQPASRELQRTAVLQPFHRATHLDKETSSRLLTECNLNETLAQLPTGQPEYSISHMQKANLPITRGRHQTSQGEPAASPGFGWVTHTCLLGELTLYDRAIIGGGDRASLGGFLGDPDQFLSILPERLCSGYEQDYTEWVAQAAKATGGRIGHIEGGIHHLWHGSVENRSYSQRYQILDRYAFDPRADIQPTGQGAWSWASEKVDMHQAINAYFHSRQEDE